MINVMIQEELYDKEFVEKWTIGFDELKERAKEYPLDVVSNITSVPAQKIHDAAVMYATIKPASLHYRLGLDQRRRSAARSR